MNTSSRDIVSQEIDFLHKEFALRYITKQLSLLKRLNNAVDMVYVLSYRYGPNDNVIKVNMVYPSYIIPKYRSHLLLVNGGGSFSIL
jgi:hypothetical protein